MKLLRVAKVIPNFASPGKARILIEFFTFSLQTTPRDSTNRTLTCASITHRRSIREHRSIAGFGRSPERLQQCSIANPDRHVADRAATRNYSAYLRITTQRDAPGGVYYSALSFRRAAAMRL
jgi:hypothetical protein